MKHFFLLTLTFFISCTLTAQNILVLKSGEKLKGKVEKFQKDTLTFKFMGNKMLFKSSEISSIYFDEKGISEEHPNSLKQNVVQQKQEGKIAGVVTYFFNDNYGDKPDVGAEILIINSSEVPNFHLSTVDSFGHAYAYKILYNSYAKRGESVPKYIADEVVSYGVDGKDGFDDLDNRTLNELYKIKFEKIIYCTKLIVDGNGTFSSNLPVGKYYVYITSNNRKGDSQTEIMGKIYCKEVVVKTGEISNVNAKFDLY